MSWLVRNWHLKLGALALATVLYTGFVYSGSFSEQVFPGVPVVGVGQPEGTYPLTQNLGTVDVRYRLASDATARVTLDSFAVTVDLSQYDMDRAPEQQPLPISVQPLTDGLTILDFVPETVPVAIDTIGEKQVPIVVERGDVPDGLSIGTPRVSDRTAVATGPQSQLTRVDRAVARVQIFESGIDVTRQVDLVAVDVDGRQLQLVELEPSTVTVDIDVRVVETSKTVPVTPALTGTVAAGFELTRVVVEPSVITLFGLASALDSVAEVGTTPISISGLTESTSFDADLALPDGTRLSGGPAGVTVTVEVEAITATRTFAVGLICVGAGDGIACLPGQGQLSVTLGGPAATLSGLSAADLTPVVDVSGLAPGVYDLTPVISLPPGVDLISISPGAVPVTLSAPATPAPTPVATPTPG